MKSKAIDIRIKNLAGLMFFFNIIPQAGVLSTQRTMSVKDRYSWLRF